MAGKVALINRESGLVDRQASRCAQTSGTAVLNER